MSDTLKAGIYTAMAAEVTITNLVSTNIYPDSAPEDIAMPYITYQVTSELGEPYQLGVSAIADTDIQFNVWAATSESRSAIKAAIRIFFDGSIRQTFGSSFCQSVRNTNNIDTVENPDDGSQNFSYGCFMDFKFWHSR
jgi:hypothetical protein